LQPLVERQRVVTERLTGGEQMLRRGFGVPCISGAHGRFEPVDDDGERFAARVLFVSLHAAILTLAAGPNNLDRRTSQSCKAKPSEAHRFRAGRGRIGFWRPVLRYAAWACSSVG